MKILCNKISYEMLIKGLLEFDKCLAEQCIKTYVPINDSNSKGAFFIDIEYDLKKINQYADKCYQNFNNAYSLFKKQYREIGEFFGNLYDQLEHIAICLEMNKEASRLDYILFKLQKYNLKVLQTRYIDQYGNDILEFCGENDIIVSVYEHCDDYVLDVYTKGLKFLTHWHPRTTQDCVNDLVDIITEKLIFRFKKSIFSKHGDISVYDIDQFNKIKHIRGDWYSFKQKLN